MIKINKNNDIYDTIANAVATIFGFAAASLVGGFCDSMISVHDGSSFAKAGMKLGKVGLETITVYSVATQMRDEIDEGVDFYNDMAGAIDEYQNKKTNAIKPVVNYEEVN